MRVLGILFLLLTSSVFAQNSKVDLTLWSLGWAYNDPNQNYDFNKVEYHALDIGLGFEISKKKWIHRFELRILHSDEFHFRGDWGYLFDEKGMNTNIKRMETRVIHEKRFSGGLGYFRGKEVFKSNKFSALFYPNIQFAFRNKSSIRKHHGNYLMDTYTNHFYYRDDYPTAFYTSLGLRVALQYSIGKIYFRGNLDNNLVYQFSSGQVQRHKEVYNDSGEIIKDEVLYIDYKLNRLFSQFFVPSLTIGVHF
jgi:hypothetical protein